MAHKVNLLTVYAECTNVTDDGPRYEKIGSYRPKSKERFHLNTAAQQITETVLFQ